MAWSPPASKWDPPSGAPGEGGGGGGGGGGGPSAGLQSLIDIDFTALDEQDLKSSGDGTATLSDGTEVEVLGTSTASTFKVTDGDGLQAKWEGGAGSSLTGSLAFDLSSFSDLKAYDQWRAFVSIKIGSMVGHASGAATFYLIRRDSATTTAIYSKIVKYDGDATYGDNVAVNGLTLGPPPTSYDGGPSGDWGSLGTSTVPSKARLSLHGIDSDVWVRGDTGDTAYADIGTLTQRARVRLQGTRFETSSDGLMGSSGDVLLFWATYDEIDITIQRLAVERWGKTS